MSQVSRYYTCKHLLCQLIQKHLRNHQTRQSVPTCIDLDYYIFPHFVLVLARKNWYKNILTVSSTLHHDVIILHHAYDSYTTTGSLWGVMGSLMLLNISHRAKWWYNTKHIIFQHKNTKTMKKRFGLPGDTLRNKL